MAAVPRLLTALVAAAVAVLAGCGGDDREEAQQTVREFVQATDEHNADRFCGDLVTQEFLEQTTGATGEQATGECRRQLRSTRGVDVRLVRIRRTEIDGDHATVTAALEIQGRRQTQVLRLEKEDGDWKLGGGGAAG